MSSRSLRAVAHAAVLVAANLVLGIGSVHAGSIFRGTFDPIDFMGIAEFDIPSSCIEADGFLTVGTNVGDCGVVDLLSASITNSPAPPVTDSLTFAPPIDSTAVFGLFWANGELIGVDTSRIGEVGPPSTGTVFTDTHGYALQFVSGHAGDSITDPHVDLYNCLDGCSFGEIQGVANTVTFVEVPEPGSMALLAGAFAAAWLARRKVRKA